MNKYKLLLGLLPIVYPSFYCRRDSLENELIFLNLGQEVKDKPIIVSDKTQYEAFENHFHLFGRVNKENRASAKDLGIAISKNLAKELKRTFPNKSFIVFLTIDWKDSTIIRFHQMWENESPYFDAKKFDYGDTEVIEFHVDSSETVY